MVDLSDNGERLIPNKIGGKTVIEHLHRYSWILDIIKDKKVLDIACGEGYGSNLMSDVATEVVGVDLSSKIIVHAQEKYKRSNLKFLTGNASNIPFENETFDVVVSYETLEHLNEHDEMISEFYRVLKNDGILIISTPEKKVYSDKNNYKNKHHTKELYLDEFKSLIKNKFDFFDVYYQKFLNTSLIFNEINFDSKIEYISGDFTEIKKYKNLNEPEYIIVLASKSGNKFKVSNSVFLNEELFEKKVVVNKIKGFRYRLIDFIFAPWDFSKVMFRKIF